jgi:hypothetical protein
MSDSQVFERTCELVAERAGITPLEARDTVLRALHEANLSPRTVGRDEMMLAVQGYLRRELASSGIPEAKRACREITADLERFENSEASPYEVFAKLG